MTVLESATLQNGLSVLPHEVPKNVELQSEENGPAAGWGRRLGGEGGKMETLHIGQTGKGRNHTLVYI